MMSPSFLPGQTHVKPLSFHYHLNAVNEIIFGITKNQVLKQHIYIHERLKNFSSRYFLVSWTSALIY